MRHCRTCRLRQQDGELSWKNIWDASTFPSQRRIELEPSHMGRWSCYWRLPRLDMRIKDRSRLSARKGWKGAKSQHVQISGSITKSKTASLHSCPIVSFAFFPLVQELTPRDQVNPDETWWGSRSALQLHHMDEFLQALSHTLTETCCDATMWPLAMRNSSISDGRQLHRKAAKWALLPH